VDRNNKTKHRDIKKDWKSETNGNERERVYGRETETERGTKRKTVETCQIGRN
jgi:hypothetical protein